ncbi:MAG TPA: putative peptide modification system cyclase [Lysobacter sp.]
MDTPEHAVRHPASTPQLRTLLLTDLCDSTSLVERLGDTPATELFREHDRLVLKLQQHWRGRLIDRSDGLLLLFERPIDGLGFALDYHRGLAAIGVARKLTLKARAGLHVGEVLTWRNSDEAVRVGAKPLEVEGLAKPMAGRLMAMARPGQILLSAVAEPLAHRAARELGERGLQLLWKSHGRWRFKGVPGAQEVHEVGEPGLAPLRAPPSTPKAWRDLPLWRRPAALAAEVALVAAIGIGMWLVTKPQPALAFAERDWVVVGDLRNLTGDARFDDALEMALRLGLEQSRYVNVLPDAKVFDTLKQMGRDPAAVDVGREIGAEVALRDGARALLLPTLAEVGGQLRVSIEVIDPHTQATVFSESATGKGADSVVRSVGKASEALRLRLGEALASVQAGSAPLAKVTTPSLDALRAFTLGQQSYARQQIGEAEQHFNQALAVDPGFAMARIGLARVAFAKTDAPTALQHMQAALTYPGRLSDRERLYASASLSMYRWDKDFLDKWMALAKLYPDLHVAAFNTANGMRYANRYPEMRDASERAAVSVAITRPAALYYRGLAEAAMGRFAKADQSFGQARAAGFPAVFVEPALMEAARGRFKQSGLLLQKLEPGPPQVVLERRMAAMTIAADAGQWREAAALAVPLRASVTSPKEPFEWAARAAVLAVQKRSGTPDAVRRETVRLIAQAERGLSASVGRTRESVVSAALYAGYVAAEGGDDRSARRALELARPVIALAPQPVLANLAAIVEARLALLANDRAAALAFLEPFRNPSALALTGVVRADAQPGRAAVTMTPADRSRAYAEWAAERPPVLEVLASTQPFSGRKRSSH